MKGAGVAIIIGLVLLALGGGGASEAVALPPTADIPSLNLLVMAGDALRSAVAAALGRDVPWADMVQVLDAMARELSAEFENAYALEPTLARILNAGVEPQQGLDLADRAALSGAIAWWMTSAHVPAALRKTPSSIIAAIVDRLSVEGGGPPEEEDTCKPAPVKFDALVPEDPTDVNWAGYQFSDDEGVDVLIAWQEIVSPEHCWHYTAAPTLGGGWWQQPNNNSGLAPDPLALLLAAELYYQRTGSEPTAWQGPTGAGREVLFVGDVILV
jgi:hypothetical protein